LVERRDNDKAIKKRMEKVEVALIEGNARMETMETCIQENNTKLCDIDKSMGGLLEAFDVANGASKKAVIFLGKLGAAGVLIYAAWRAVKEHVYQLFS
jgi:hypothetical protein